MDRRRSLWPSLQGSPPRNEKEGGKNTVMMITIHTEEIENLLRDRIRERFSLPKTVKLHFVWEESSHGPIAHIPVPKNWEGTE
jgi:hypothetical protein